MPKYRVRIYTWDDDIETHDVELPALQAARAFMVKMASDWLAGAPDEFWQDAEIRVDLRDERDLVLFNLVILSVAAPSMLQ